MFLQKTMSIVASWGLSAAKAEGIRREALRYGTRVDRNPSAIKRAFKSAGLPVAETKTAHKNWQHDYYLLFTLPSYLVPGQAKGSPQSPGLAGDVAYARSVLTPIELETLADRFQIPPPMTFAELIHQPDILASMKTQADRCSFLQEHDLMYQREESERERKDRAYLRPGNFSDVEQMLTQMLLGVYYMYLLSPSRLGTKDVCLRWCLHSLKNEVNTFLTSTNFCGRGPAQDTTGAYAEYNKLNMQYLYAKNTGKKKGGEKMQVREKDLAAKMKEVKSQFQKADFVKKTRPLEIADIEHVGADESMELETGSLLLDLGKILPPKRFQLVCYLMGKPSPRVMTAFEKAMRIKGVHIGGMRPDRILRYFEKYLGVSREALQENPQLRDYLGG